MHTREKREGARVGEREVRMRQGKEERRLEVRDLQKNRRGGGKMALKKEATEKNCSKSGFKSISLLTYQV